MIYYEPGAISFCNRMMITLLHPFKIICEFMYISQILNRMISLAPNDLSSVVFLVNRAER